MPNVHVSHESNGTDIVNYLQAHQNFLTATAVSLMIIATRHVLLLVEFSRRNDLQLYSYILYFAWADQRGPPVLYSP